MIPEKEIKILKQINFSDKILKIRLEFSREKGDTFWIFKKEDIFQAFRELGYFPKYLKGGGYLLSKNFNQYLFEYNFVVNKNNFEIYLFIYINNTLIENRIENIFYLLQYIPYDASLAERLNSQSFILETKTDFKTYIQKIISLLDEFVKEYICNLGNQKGT